MDCSLARGRQRVLRRHNRFTLVEMLVVIAIIGILAALLMPGLHGALAGARSTYCQNTLKGFGIANSVYLSDWGGVCVPLRQGAVGARKTWGSNAFFQAAQQMNGCLSEGWAPQYHCPESLFRQVTPWADTVNKRYNYSSSYGMNFSGTYTQSGATVKQYHLTYTDETFAWRISKIKAPSRKTLIADGAASTLQMETDPANCGYYLHGEGIYPPLAGYAPRHQSRKGANHLMADSHATYVPAESSLGNTELWNLFQK